jgi:hypothetical protein
VRLSQEIGQHLDLTSNSFPPFFKATIAIAFLQWLSLPSMASPCNGRNVVFPRKSLYFFGFGFVFFFLGGGWGRELLGLLFSRGFGCSLLFSFYLGWLPLCVPNWFEIPLVLIILAFTI